MNSQFSQKYLVALLLLVIGMLLGIVFMMFQRPSHYRPVEIQQASEFRSLRPDPAENSDLDAPYIQFRSIASTVTAAVVFIEANVTQNRISIPNDDNHRNLDRDDMWQRFLPGRRVAVSGSGVLISKDGYILTNNHVIENADRRSVRVNLQDKRAYRARIVGQDPNTDLAVIKIDDDDLPYLQVGDSDQVEVGDWVLAVGNPFRLRSTVTAGIVSALARSVDVINTPMRIESFIQTDAAINKGNSGGALVDVQGNLIGINTAIATGSGTYEGYGFAIPSNMALKIAGDMIEHGEVRRAYLGVEIASIDYARARTLGMPSVQGVEVSRVVVNGSADKAGIRARDVILEINGYPVNESHELQARIAMVRPGDHVDVRLWSSGQEKNTRVHLVGAEDASVRELLRGTTPEPAQIDPEASPALRELEFRSGFKATEFADASDYFNTRVTVTRVDADSKAYQGGLQQDDVILEADGNSITGVDDLNNLMRRAFRDRNRILLTVMRGSETFYVGIER